MESMVSSTVYKRALFTSTQVSARFANCRTGRNLEMPQYKFTWVN